MAEERHIYRHEDGREVSLTEAGYSEFYGPSSGFVKDHAETPADFIAVGIPKPKRKRIRPRAKDAAPVAEPTGEETGTGEG